MITYFDDNNHSHLHCTWVARKYTTSKLVLAKALTYAAAGRIAPDVFKGPESQLII
jgi:hypothetical protein